MGTCGEVPSGGRCREGKRRYLKKQVEMAVDKVPSGPFLWQDLEWDGGQGPIVGP